MCYLKKMKLVNVLPLFVVITFGNLNTAHGQSLVCPAVRTTSGWLDLFPLPCKKNSECRLMSGEHLCCKGFCTKGIRAAVAQQRASKSQNSLVDASSSSASITPAADTTTGVSSTPTSSTPSTTTGSTTTTSTTTTSTTTPSTTSSTTTTTTTTTTPRPSTTSAEPPRPFLQLLPLIPTLTTQKTPLKTSKTQKLVCPKAGLAPAVLFPIPCEKNSQCRLTSGPDQVCCEGRCVKGVPAPRPTSKPQSHQPILGVIPRECPATPLGELLFEVQTCATDADCWPRVCCPDGARSYCRTARARLDMVPVAKQLDRPVRMFEQYLQCTAPPQYDLFPQKCSSSVDCFPNLCCAEGGKKHCRPPQRSLLALLTGVSQVR